jgi:hypothetical protein
MLTPDMAGKAIAQAPPLPTSSPLPAGHNFARLYMEDHANELDENGNIRHCPTGSIPMRRTTASDPQRFATLKDFFAKGPDRTLLGSSDDSGSNPPMVAGFEYARTDQSVTNLGAQGFINIWDPYVQISAEHSLSQIWVVRNDDATMQTAEAGSVVYPSHFGDSNSHFFTYWTNDAYQTTGCWDMECDGFVHYSGSTPGDYFTTISSRGGTQWEVEQKLL